MAFLLLVSLSSYVQWFVGDKPVVTDEYLVKFNQLGASDVLARDNAWPGYEKAISLFVEADETLEGISAFKVRSLAAEAGDIDGAIDDCLIIARVGTHWQTSLDLIDQLVGISVGGVARSELLRIVATYDPVADALRDIQMEIKALYPNGVPYANFNGERLVVLDAVQHSFTKGGFGGGHMIPGQFTAFASEALGLPEGHWTTIFRRVLLWPMDIGISVIHARRNKTVVKIDEVYDEVDRRSKLSPYEQRVRNIGDWQELGESVNPYRYGLVHMLLPNESRVSELRFRFRADHEASLTILALKRYYSDNGAYPSDLQDLVDAGYLSGIPMDPFSGGPLVYRCVADRFVLYSVGRDFVDGGGQRGVDDQGRPKVWANQGDRVFWPLMGQSR